MNYCKRAPVTVNPVVVNPQERRVSLDGQWDFRLDPEDRGLSERWFDDAGIFIEKIEVPGSWQGQGFGGDGKDILWDFQLAVRTFRATYKGTGWYVKRFRPPAEWQGMRIWVNLGGVHPSAEVWLNGVRLGENHAPFVPFGFEITGALRFDGENLLVVRVHEQSRMYGAVFNWQGNWSGLYRGVELTATGPCFLERFWVNPDVDRETLRIRALIGGFDPANGALTLRVSAQAIGNVSCATSIEVQVTTELVEFDLPVPGPRLWSPDTPNLYRVDAVLSRRAQVMDALSERVGFLKLSTEGKHFLINGEPYYMRGTGDFVSNPETGCPDTNRERWRRKLATLRSYGYNYVRCQSFVPAPEYFDVADEVGLLVQSEPGMLGAWSGYDIWHVYAWPQPSPRYYGALKEQWDRVVMRDVNHPSANIYCMGNELRPKTEYPRTAWQCYRDTKAIKPSTFVIWTDGKHQEDMPEDFVNDEAEIDAKCAKPLIQHEYRWWSSFPDVRIMHRYTGAVRPYGAEIALQAAVRHGISFVLPRAAETSQRLQFVEAKTNMEARRRDFPLLAGICHFNAMDLNPTPQGIMDEFYERKYADSALWQQTNGDTVILADLGFDDRVLSAGGTLQVALSVSDFSHPPLGRPNLEWELAAGERVVATGTIPYSHEPFRTCPAGSLAVKIPDVPHPAKATLRATLREGKRVFRNSWDFWLFPERSGFPPSVGFYGKPEYTWLTGLRDARPVSSEDLIAGDPAAKKGIRVVLTERLDDALVEFARAGGRIVLAASEGVVRPFSPKLGAGAGHYFFTPPGNYPPYEDGHDGTIIACHPMLGNLPHEGFADLQFFRMMSSDSPPIDLEPLGLNDCEPVIRVMNSYQVCHPLAYLIEHSLGKGGLIICALNLDQTLPEARYLLAQIFDYAAGDGFRPVMELSAHAVMRIVAGSSLP